MHNPFLSRHHLSSINWVRRGLSYLLGIGHGVPQQCIALQSSRWFLQFHFSSIPDIHPFFLLFGTHGRLSIVWHLPRLLLFFFLLSPHNCNTFNWVTFHFHLIISKPPQKTRVNSFSRSLPLCSVPRLFTSQCIAALYVENLCLFHRIVRFLQSSCSPSLFRFLSMIFHWNKETHTKYVWCT